MKCPLPLRHVGIVVIAIVAMATGVSSQAAERLLCRDDWECDTRAGEVCSWQYEGCELGRCMCNPYTHLTKADGTCVLRLRGGDVCHGNDVCPAGMTCQGERCICTQGYLTGDRLYCRQVHQRLLGDQCRAGEHACLERAAPGLSQYAYTGTNVVCGDGGVCRCMQGFKQQYLSCVRYELGDRGCTQAYHCQAGAMCIDGACVCPRGYHPVAGGTKCGKDGAVENVDKRQRCDEILGTRYCRKGLVCHQCGGDTYQTCVKYQQIVSDYSQPLSGASRGRHRPSLAVITTIALLLSRLSL